MKRKKKRVIKEILRIILILLCLLMIAFLIMEILKDEKVLGMYTASTDPEVVLYDESFNQVTKLRRSLKLEVSEKVYTNDNLEYRKTKQDGNVYYILNDNLKDTYEDSVLEKYMYVKTPVIIYKDIKGYEIASFAPKASTLEVIGFDEVNDGVVNAYKVKYENIEGYVYSKYLSQTKEEAEKVYDEENTYAIHKDREYSYELYGGHASQLDYYPYKKENIKGNVMPDEAKTLYLNAGVLESIDDYINLAKSSSINAFVIDIYDGYMAYESEVAKKYSESAYNSAAWTKDEYKSFIDKVKNSGIYVIGRIVAFNNPHFAKDNKDDAISYNGSSLSWVSAYSRKAWEYNVALALEAIKEFGFNEIQYDYVRFPESSYSWSVNKGYDFKNKYNESKGEAIQNFLFYATDKIHEAGAYISADVFGEAAYSYVTAYGQYWPAISNIVDVISAMPYPDHFNKYDFGFSVPVWTRPYELMKAWASYASERQKEIPSPAKVRTWIQTYDTIREPYIVYGTSEIRGQIEALYEAGLDNGFITWNSGSSYRKYNSVSSAFKENYR